MDTFSMLTGDFLASDGPISRSVGRYLGDRSLPAANYSSPFQEGRLCIDQFFNCSSVITLDTRRIIAVDET